VAHAFTVLVLPRSILTEKIARRGFHVTREHSIDPLEVLFAREIMLADVMTIPADTPVSLAAHALFSAGNRQRLYPVVDDDGRLAGAITRREIEAYRFQPMLNETSRAHFAAREQLVTGPLKDAIHRWLANPNDGEAADFIEADENEVGLTRTRCVPTRLFAGHADNALPQLATAMINCRIFPGVDPNAIRTELEHVVADPTVVVTRNDDYVASIASPLRPDVTAAYTNAVHALHPRMPVFPEMSTGASDGRPFRVSGIPVYGVNGGWTITPIDNRAHGKDERLPVQSLYDNVVHWQLMLRDLAGK